jgi:phosphonate transport system substrate-binding protein
VAAGDIASNSLRSANKVFPARRLGYRIDMMKRVATRCLLQFLCAFLAAASFCPCVARADEASPVVIGLTPVFLDNEAAFLQRFRDYLQERMQRKVVFVQRGSYREVVDLVRTGKLDFAWICGYPYVRHAKEMKLLAVPLWRGEPLYQSYLIVPSSDSHTRSLLGLHGKVFAYSDPDSNSGYLYPQYLLRQAEEDPASFFSRTFFTWAHRKVVEAVASSLAQGGAVDGYVWETLNLLHPELTARTRVVEKSPQFGHPPFVARANIGERDFRAMQQVLQRMARDKEGQSLLRQLNLDGFVAGEPKLFEGIGRMAKSISPG